MVLGGSSVQAARAESPDSSASPAASADGPSSAPESSSPSSSPSPEMPLDGSSSSVPSSSPGVLVCDVELASGGCPHVWTDDEVGALLVGLSLLILLASVGVVVGVVRR